MTKKPVTTKKPVAAPNPAAKKPAATKPPAKKASAKKPAGSAAGGKAKATPAAAAAVDQTLANKLMHHLNGCADDVFEHHIRFLSMRQEEGNVFKGTSEDKTLKTGPSPFTIHWKKPLKTAEDINKLTLYIIDAIIEDYSDSDEWSE